MIAYHVDRGNNLQVGQTIDFIDYPIQDDSSSFMASKLFENKISKHGQFYLSDAALNCAPDTVCSIIEYETELVRRSFFPEMPSRFQSFFAVEELSDLMSWSQALLSPNARIFEVEFDPQSYVKLDGANLPSAFLNMNGLSYSPSTNFQKAYDYWANEDTVHPQFELLIQAPLTVQKEIHLSIVPR